VPDTHTHTRGENSFDILNKLRKLFRVLERDFLPYLLVKVKVLWSPLAFTPTKERV
tara:strand:+ start:3186 stop:3353 length:168 start_codon:yes stop_codon:yes gene_type:complete